MDGDKTTKISTILDVEEQIVEILKQFEADSGMAVEDVFVGRSEEDNSIQVLKMKLFVPSTIEV